jgi:hypothetical protein
MVCPLLLVWALESMPHMPHHTLPQNQEFHKQILNLGNLCNNFLEKEITQSLKSVFNTWSDLQEVWELDRCLKTKREICSTQRNLSPWIYPPNVMGCKQDKRSHTYHLGWLFEKQWVCLPGWCCKLELVTKKDLYVIFHRGRKYMSQLNFCQYIVHICWR